MRDGEMAIERAEQAPQESEGRYERAMLASEAGLWDWDVARNVYYVSPALLNLCGFAPGTGFSGHEDFIRRAPFLPDDRERFEKAVRELFTGRGSHLSMEIRYRSGDETRWVNLVGMCFRDAARKVERWTGIATDITDRQLVLETLRASESRFRALVELNAAGFWQQDENLRYLPSLYPHHVTGYANDERVGRTRWELPGDVTPLCGSWDSHKADLEARRPFRDFEYSRVKKDGQIGYYSASGVPIFDDHGVFKGYYGVMIDITERERGLAALQRSEAALRLSEERYALAVDGASQGIFDWDMPNDRVFHSPKAQAFLGLEPGQSWRQRREWAAMIRYHPDDLPHMLAGIRRHLSNETPTCDIEYRVIRPDGEVRWVRQRGVVRRDASGKAYRMAGSIEDITDRKLALTERKRAEDELRKMEERLRLAQRLESMGTLAGGIAHDFNNILGAVLGYGEMAMRSAKKGSRLHRDLASIVSAGERGRALVDRVLAFSRSGVADCVPVHVEAIVREVLDQVAANLPANMSVEPRLNAGRAAMLGDSTQVHQVVMNLALNGVQAMPLGGVLRVTLDVASFESAQPATIGSIAKGDYIVLRVSDTGSGIPADVMERMFDPFFTTKEVGVGTGLGLSLVHGIVTSVDGAIDVTTEIDKGSTFTVYLRRSGDALEARADEEDRPLPRGRGERVLVVDDEESLVRLATATLKRLGYSPVGFTSSVNALQEFRANPASFDAIITDERMPVVTGTTIIREVRRINASIPILLMSGFVGGAAVANARELGASEVLTKPVLAGELATRLARALRP